MARGGASEYSGPRDEDEDEEEVLKFMTDTPERHRKLWWPYEPQVILTVEDLMAY